MPDLKIRGRRERSRGEAEPGLRERLRGDRRSEHQGNACEAREDRGAEPPIVALAQHASVNIAMKMGEV